jgi:DinB superfamily
MLAPIFVQLNTIDKLLEQFDQKAIEISTANVGWHLEHLLLVNGRVAEALIQSNPAAYQWRFNWRKTIILFTKKIPRGKAKAPKSARPEGNQTAEELRQRIPGLKFKLESLTQLHPNANFQHPFFGMLNLKTTIRFLFVHNQHHLKIVQDILAQNK